MIRYRAVSAAIGVPVIVTVLQLRTAGSATALTRAQRNPRRTHLLWVPGTNSFRPDTTILALDVLWMSASVLPLRPSTKPMHESLMAMRMVCIVDNVSARGMPGIGAGPGVGMPGGIIITGPGCGPGLGG